MQLESIQQKNTQKDLVSEDALSSKRKRRRVSVASSFGKQAIVRASSDAMVEQVSELRAVSRESRKPTQIRPTISRREVPEIREEYPAAPLSRPFVSHRKSMTTIYPHSKIERPSHHLSEEMNFKGGRREDRPNADWKKKKTSRKVSIRKKDYPEVVEPIKYDSPFKDMTEPFRLNRFLSNAGVCSRREADKYIEAGRVKVNGRVVSEMGERVLPHDEVLLDDQPVTLESKVYILLNKPKNCVTTLSDPQKRKTVMDIVKKACTERIYPVGRLDRNTTGVLLITNDGDLSARLTHPEYEKKKIYHVWLDRPVTEDHMQQIATGIELEDGEIHADAISYVQEDDYSQVGIEIHSGRNRIVRRIFEHLGYKVIKLDRVYFAGLTKKDLPRGRWRYLTEEEVRYLKMGAFTKAPKMLKNEENRHSHEAKKY